MKILFAALTQGYYRNLESVVEALAFRGHQIYLGHERADSAIGGQALVDRLAGRFPNIRRGVIPGRDPASAKCNRRRRVAFGWLANNILAGEIGEQFTNSRFLLRVRQDQNAFAGN